MKFIQKNGFAKTCPILVTAIGTSKIVLMNMYTCTCMYVEKCACIYRTGKRSMLPDDSTVYQEPLPFLPFPKQRYTIVNCLTYIKFTCVNRWFMSVYLKDVWTRLPELMALHGSRLLLIDTWSVKVQSMMFE